MSKTKKIKSVVIVILLLAICIFLREIITGRITSVDDFRNLIYSYGPMGFMVLIGIQALQSVLPILPGALGFAAGSICFGIIPGFLCNYAGIIFGSMVAFFLARRYGKPLVLELFSEEMHDKWMAKFQNEEKVEKIMFWLIVLPFFPDDFLCYLAGLLSISAKRFLTILLVGKPLCLLAYSIFFGFI